MKKIIFIGGTARSGSTLLDLILANDPKAMSLGEIDALFYPTRKHHFEEINRLKESEEWREILNGGKANLYPNLIKCFPQIDIFIDSSKNPFWYNFHQQTKKDNYSIKNVLIYKTPYELANSFIKRGKDTQWIKTYISYHKKYFSLINNSVSIAYKDLIVNDKFLEELCHVLDLNYFENKKHYWDKEQMTFFGSNTVKSGNSFNSSHQITRQTRQTISYDGVKEEYVERINQAINRKPELLRIEREIRKKELFQNTDLQEDQEIGYSSFYLFLIASKMKLKRLYNYYFPKDIFKNK